jgi:DNA-directed RNA polymerase specialized sigma24 family protein
MLNDTQARFDQTRWTVVLTAASQNESGATEALEHLCKIYWPPLYAFLRRRGQSPENAKDLTQGFFAHLLDGDRLHNVHPEKGKFRSFLLACLNNYVSVERAKSNAAKRGSGQICIPINISEAETGMGIDPPELQDPALIFEKKWASVLLQFVLHTLRDEYAAGGKTEFFEVLQPFVTGEAVRGDFAEAAARLKLSEGAARVAAARLRDEYRIKLRHEIGRTVGDDSQIDDEIRHLLRILRNS